MNRSIVRCGALALLVASLFAVPALAGVRYGTRTLRQGLTGADVKTMQRYLTKIGYKTTADGQFGSGTKKRVLAFERRYKQHRDGRLTVVEQKVLKKKATKPAASAGGASLDTASTADSGIPGKATLNPDGTATPPPDAPAKIQALILAGNRIAHKPYIYGGGHASFTASGYDCSGSVSYALHAAGLLATPRNSTGLESWGQAGRGRWLSIYANAGHAWLRVAGLRFDTSGLSQDGTRWHSTNRSASGYVFRHAAGL